eukprot:scaffold20169_cov69-Phaeocystis_antarctica.AAC.3
MQTAAEAAGGRRKAADLLELRDKHGVPWCVRRLPHAAEARQQAIGVAQSPLPGHLQVGTAELNAADWQRTRSVDDACWPLHIAPTGQHRQHEHSAKCSVAETAIPSALRPRSAPLEANSQT